MLLPKPIDRVNPKAVKTAIKKMRQKDSCIMTDEWAAQSSQVLVETPLLSRHQHRRWTLAQKGERFEPIEEC
jgi:hypothetical protein